MYIQSFTCFFSTSNIFAQIFLTLTIISSVPVSAQQPVAVRLQAEEVPGPGGEEEPADGPRGHRLQRAGADHGPALVQGHQPGTVQYSTVQYSIVPYSTILAQDFACKPEVEVTEPVVVGRPGLNATLRCQITGNPVPGVKVSSN